jgi:nickel-dependent lactate racemase
VLLFSRGHQNDNLTAEDLEQGLCSALDKLGPRKKVLAVPPDLTRLHSRAGTLTYLTWQYYRKTLTDVLIALGTHTPITQAEIRQMFHQTPLELFRQHNWRKDVTTLGEIPADFVSKISQGRVNYSWPAQVNRLVAEPAFDLVLSIGQIVPHEVSGIANYNKNIFIGTGGPDAINKSHFLGAVFGVENIMGRINNPVRSVLDFASENFAKNLPIVYVLTVVSADENGSLKTRGLFIGDDIECFSLAAQLSLKVNIRILDRPLDKVVVYLDPAEYKSTWLGNKSIYRTRMAVADGGELIVLAPGVCRFGEDPQIDNLIRKYGYVGTDRVLDAVEKNDVLKQNLSAAAHLIHGSSENRFQITYCPGKLTKDQIEAVNFNYADLSQMLKKYNPEKLRDGFNTLDSGEEVFFISNPGLGLWSWKEKFKQL